MRGNGEGMVCGLRDGERERETHERECGVAGEGLGGGAARSRKKRLCNARATPRLSCARF